jgi:hypothetical protein
MNALTLITSTAMVLVLMGGERMCGHVIVNVFLEMSLVNMNAMNLMTSYAMVLVSMDGTKTYGNAIINAYP